MCHHCSATLLRFVFKYVCQGGYTWTLVDAFRGQRQQIPLKLELQAFVNQALCNALLMTEPSLQPKNWLNCMHHILPFDNEDIIITGHFLKFGQRKQHKPRVSYLYQKGKTWFWGCHKIELEWVSRLTWGILHIKVYKIITHQIRSSLYLFLQHLKNTLIISKEMEDKWRFFVGRRMDNREEMMSWTYCDYEWMLKLVSETGCRSQSQTLWVVFFNKKNININHWPRNSGRLWFNGYLTVSHAL